MASHVSSYVKTTTAAVQRVRDQLSFAYTAKPQAMTAYIRFFVQSIPTSGERVLLQVGTNGTSNPRWYVAIQSVNYVTTYHNGVSSVSSSVAHGAAVGVVSEVRVTLTATGIIQTHMSSGGGAETSGSAAAANALPSAWASQHIMVNSAGVSAVNWQAYTHILVARGIVERAMCRELAGV